MLAQAGVADSGLSYVRERVYKGVRCNWKVFCDNFLDGGYHVPVAHKGLAGSVDMASYSNHVFPHASVQTVRPASGGTAEGMCPV